MKYLHTMIRVNDLEQSISFYSDVLGMKLVAKNDYPDGKFTLAFMSYGNSKEDPCIELTYNYDRHSYILGDAFGHLALETEDIYKTCEKVRLLGAKITREPGPMKHQSSQGATVIAFIEDPNGFKIELIQKKY